MFIITKTKFLLFDFKTLNNIEIVETFLNPKGVFSMSSNAYTNIVAYPFLKQGSLAVKSYDDPKEPIIINAHESSIICISMNNMGTFLATSSFKGTIIRIFDAKTATFILELRRGIDKAEILSLQFDFFSNYLLCNSDKGTVHIFSLVDLNTENKTEATIHNKKGLFSNISKKLGVATNYFDANWSFANLRIGDEYSFSTYCGNRNNKIIVVSKDLNYYTADVDLIKGGDCVVDSKEQLKIDFNDNNYVNTYYKKG